MTEKKRGGKAGSDLAQLRAQLGRSTPVARGEPAEPQEEPVEARSTKAGGAVGRRPDEGSPGGSNGSARGRRSGQRRKVGKTATQTDEKPRRITVDLDTERYRVLRDFAFEERTKGTEVLRGLLDLLRDDPGVADELRERLAAGEG